jgi:hypothetical protein
MEKKRLDIAELRQQRERIRRMVIGAPLVTVVFILASCQGLAPRAAAAPPQQQAPAQITVHGRLGPVGPVSAAAQARTSSGLAAEGKADLAAATSRCCRPMATATWCAATPSSCSSTGRPPLRR